MHLQTVWMRSLICAFIVRTQQSQAFSKHVEVQYIYPALIGQRFSGQRPFKYYFEEIRPQSDPGLLCLHIYFFFHVLEKLNFVLKL